MNRQNQYFDENRFMGINLFKLAQHSSLVFPTKTSLSGPNVELIKNDLLALPVVIVRHYDKLQDPIEEFIKIKKDHWFMRTRLESRLVRLYKLKKISRENKITTKNMREYIIKKFTDPIPYVDKSDGFIFYPHHGTLKSYQADDDKEYFVHVVDDYTLRFDEITSEMPLKKVQFINKRNLHPTEVMIDESLSFGGIRYRKEVRIAKIPDSLKDESVVETLDRYKHKYDILSSTLNGGYLSTIDSKFVLRRYNVTHQFEDVNFKLSDYFIDENILPVSLGSFRNEQAKKHCISFTTKKSFGILDTRIKKKISLENSFSSRNLVLQCDKIFTHSNSMLNSNFVYIASSHLLYMYDYRKLNKPLVHWTHQLYKPPMMLSTEMYGLNEVICASSHMGGDLKIFNTDGSSVNYYPYKPASIAKTYNKLREQGLYLMSDNINEHINGSVTGVTLFSDPKSKSIKLFTQHHSGDVFENTLKCKLDKRPQVEDLRVPIEKFQLWENFVNVPLNPNKEYTAKERILNGDLIVDDIVKLESLPKYLSNQKAFSAYQFEDLEVENRQRVILEPKWKVSINDARKCDDLLAKEIMLLWDDVESESDVEPMEVDEENYQGIDRVSLWLVNSNDQPQFVDDIKIEEEYKPELMEFLPEITSTQANTSSIKRKSRVAGF